MGSRPSTRRERELDRWKERDLANAVDYDRQLTETNTIHDEKVKELLAETAELKQQLHRAEESLKVTTTGLENEQRKNMALMFGDLPLNLLKDTSTGLSQFNADNTSLNRTYSMATIAQCDVVGFARLSTHLEPHEAVSVIDKIQAIIDKAYKHDDMLIMERYSDGCIVATGLSDYSNTGFTHGLIPPSRGSTITPLSLIDSSYGSEELLDDMNSDETSRPMSSNPTTVQKTPSFYASLLAAATLHLMCLSNAVKIPRARGKQRQLQLRVAMHSGPCSAGVVGLQTAVGSAHIPHYKLFGSTMTTTRRLCTTGLALQIRVSKPCHDLLVQAGGFKFERCPDFTTWKSSKSIESYWLVEKEGEDLALPSLDLAISLSDYEDIEM